MGTCSCSQLATDECHKRWLYHFARQNFQILLTFVTRTNPSVVLCLLAYSYHKELKCCSFYINPPAILNIDVRNHKEKYKIMHGTYNIS